MPPVFLMPPAFLMPPVFLMTLVHGLLACVATSGHGSISAPMLRPGRSKPEFRRLPMAHPLTLQCLSIACALTYLRACPRLARLRCNVWPRLDFGTHAAASPSFNVCPRLAHSHCNVCPWLVRGLPTHAASRVRHLTLFIS